MAAPSPPDGARHARHRPRSPAQIEASRRNGARSRGPVTAEGRARASRNALKHGLAALHHVAVEGEDAAELEALTGRLLAELAPESELEARLVRRMAIAFWKGERAERMEAALIAAAPRQQRNWVGTYVPVDPLGTFEIQRFNAIRGYQAQQGRELSRCLRELRQLRREPLAECTDEPEREIQNEPERPAAPANDDAPATTPTADSPPQEKNAERTRAGIGPCLRADRSTAGGGRPGVRDLGSIAPAASRGRPAGARSLDQTRATGRMGGLARFLRSVRARAAGVGPGDVGEPGALHAEAHLVARSGGEAGSPGRRAPAAVRRR